MYSRQDLWGPRLMAWLMRWRDHGAVLNLTGAPLCLYSFRRRLAGDAHYQDVLDRLDSGVGG